MCRHNNVLHTEPRVAQYLRSCCLPRPGEHGRYPLTCMRFTTQHLLTLVIGIALLATLYGNYRIKLAKRIRRVQQAVEVIHQVPDNRYLCDQQFDPVALIRAVNHLVDMDRDEAIDAIVTSVNSHPNRNNVEFVANLLLQKRIYEVSPTMLETEGLLFAVECPPGNEFEVGIDNVDELISLMHETEFRTTKLPLPVDAKPIVERVLEKSDVKRFVLYNFVRHAGKDPKKLFENCNNDEQMLRRFRQLEFQTDRRKFTYAITENNGG